MKVLKFGGSSLVSGDLFDHIADLWLKNKQQGQIAVVLSAPAKVTNLLVKMVDDSIQGKDFQSDMKELENIFFSIIEYLANKYIAFDKVAITNEISKIFDVLTTKFVQIQQVGFCSDSIYPSIICMGEQCSILIMSFLLKTKGASITIINPVTSLIAINSDYKEASVDLEKSKAIIQALSINIDKNDTILMAGFTGGNDKKEMVSLGRNGSDYSAALLAVCLNAKACEIWTDVDGIYTCDPRLVPDAKLLKTVSYDEAMELSFFGASVLHPKTIAPLKQYGIPCYVKNTQNPKAKGSVVKEPNMQDPQTIKGITCLNNIVLFNISCSGLRGTVGVSARIFSAVAKANISLIFITQSSPENSISFCLDHKDKEKAKQALEKELSLELEKKLINPIEILENLSIVTVVGAGMKHTKGIAARIFTAVAKSNISVIAIAQGSSGTSVSIVVKKAESIMSLKAIHQLIFDTEQHINLFIVGTGGVAIALIQQIKQQKQILRAQNIDLKICGIINSKRSIFNLNGLDLDNWEIELNDANSKLNFDELIELIDQNKILNPMLVDCTSSDVVVDKYTDFVINGLHIVTPNKKANTRSYEFYQIFRELVKKHQRQFKYDTNVGAGLPVIENLQNLLNAGDQLLQFTGILSGSLSFIFGRLDEGLKFSEAIRLAKEAGYTEPDPREDLSGVDVARKVLIIARETGLKLELSDVKIEPLIPESYMNYSLEEFMQRLPELDGSFEKVREKIHRKGEVLRYVGEIAINQECAVRLISVAQDHPLYPIKNGENSLSFLTKYYQPKPLILQGYGAGYNVTAAGVFADILRVSYTNLLGINI